MRKNKLFLLSGLACLLGAGLFAAHVEAKAPVIEETKQTVRGEEGIQVAEYHAPALAQDVPQRQWEDKDTGMVIFGVTMGLSVALIAIMVITKAIKKNKGE